MKKEEFELKGYSQEAKDNLSQRSLGQIKNLIGQSCNTHNGNPNIVVFNNGFTIHVDYLILTPLTNLK